MTVRVLIAVPSLDFVCADFAFSLAALCQRFRGEQALTNFRSSVISDSRNHLALEAFKVDATHILWIDSDMCFPPDALDRLLARDKDIVGCAYAKREEMHSILAGPVLPVLPGGSTRLREVEWLPFGFVLTKRSVFETISRPWFAYETRADSVIPEDKWFCRKARKAKLSIWLDQELSVELGHVGTKVYRI